MNLPSSPHIELTEDGSLTLFAPSFGEHYHSTHGAVQERSVLRDQTDLGAQAFLGNVADVLPVNRNRTALRFVEAQEQVDDGGFARAAASDQADFFARADGEVEAV